VKSPFLPFYLIIAIVVGLIVGWLFGFFLWGLGCEFGDEVREIKLEMRSD